jgi:Ni,Fe-hydrogenase I cytochrome b subunit
MTTKRPVKIKVYIRAVVAIFLIVVWVVVAVTGFLLYAAPSGQRSGQQLLLFNLTKSEWGDIHWWAAVATAVITTAHIIIDWKALRGVIRYLISVHRERGLQG